MGIQGREKADIEAKKHADTRIRADTKFSLCPRSYSPKKRQSVVERMGNQGRFAGSKIWVPRAENTTNNKM